MPLDVLVNLVASLLAFLLGWLIRTLVAYFRNTRPVTRLWRVNRRSPVTAVVGSAHDREALWESDALAAMSIRQGLARDLRIHSVTTMRSSAFDMRGHAEENIVLIGGPAMNEVWNVYADRVNAPYEFRRDDNGYWIEAREGGASFGISGSGGHVRDHALIVLARNPFATQNRLLMMAGCGFLATLAAPVIFEPAYARDLTRRFDTSRSLALVLAVEDIDGYMPRPVVVAHAHFTQSPGH
ncbi:hypothetical protein OG302_01960 [Streptomyces sp. NBC_01283]|uniref:hypothetical protein n=1 Tax=Streptomyces sp. NBC_01283 TaxID=2903812 RepID=UPI00352C320E|nr:hypothetical protein OG302_01960 [Streptomyces sp. NBC_01283]